MAVFGTGIHAEPPTFPARTKRTGERRGRETLAGTEGFGENCNGSDGKP